MLEFIDGMNLHEMIDKVYKHERELPKKHRHEILMKIASGLVHLHDHEIVHRDGNLIFTGLISA